MKVPATSLRFQRAALCSLVLVISHLPVAASGTAGELPAGTGLANPDLAFGLSSIVDWNPAQQFIDKMKTAREWKDGNRNDISIEDLDPSFWPTRISKGRAFVHWSPSGWSAGDYVLTYSGAGTISVTATRHGLVINNQEPGRIEFTYRSGSVDVAISETDPDNTGDYIRDIKLIRADQQALYNAGEIFNPDWLAVIRDARQVRFMDWQQTNGTPVEDWSDRPRTDDAAYRYRGAPVEVMVNLANQIGADPWFCMPPRASDDYIRQFATYVRDHLDPDLVAHVEYANETWNMALGPSRWLADQAKTVWGVSEQAARLDFAAKRATETALIWDDVFGEDADARVVNVLAVQNGNSRVANRELTAQVWADKEPDNYVPPYSVFDALAVTTYFGSKTLAKPELRDELIDAVQDPNVDAADWLAARLLEPDYPSSLPKIAAAWAEMKEVADRYGLDLIAYEGGQHVHHNFPTKRLAEDDVNALRDFLPAFVRSQQMANLYDRLWSAWTEIGDGPFMHYTDVRSPSRWGSWGLLNSLDDENPRAELLFARNAEEDSWFGDGGGTRYQQGVISFAGDGGETLTGTQKTDYLVGGAGDDTFIPGAGQDGINGGEGADTVVLAGEADDYSIAREGAGYRITGPATSHYLVDVEAVKFDSGAPIALGESDSR